MGRESAGHERVRSRGAVDTESEGRGVGVVRRRHDDAVLDEVARAAYEAFPLLPAPTRSTPGSSARASRDRDVTGGAVSPYQVVAS